MACWLYQMSGKEWQPERYRTEVWEGSVTTSWGVGKITPSTGMPQPGEIIILFYARTTTTDPGVYGWGIVLWCNGQEINFRPAPPSDYLKMSPVPEATVRSLIDTIRGKMPRGTMWEVDKETLEPLRQKIAEHFYGIPKDETRES